MKQISSLILIVSIINLGNGEILSDDRCGKAPDNSWVAKVHANNSTNFCYANIINIQWLLGSAACFSDKIPLANYTIILDATTNIKGAPVEIDKVIKSPKYNPTLGAGYDLALIKMKRALQFNNTVSPICLADYDREVPFKFDVDTPCLDINSKTMVIAEDKDCQGLLRSHYHPQYMFCGGLANCKPYGTNGAPVICKVKSRNTWYLAAMASWGRDCTWAQPQFEAYTKLFGESNYINWINETIHPNKKNYV